MPNFAASNQIILLVYLFFLPFFKLVLKAAIKEDSLKNKNKMQCYVVSAVGGKAANRGVGGWAGGWLVAKATPIYVRVTRQQNIFN